MVIAPHPDDETFGCGGTMAKRLNEGYEVIVVIVTDGRNLLKTILGIESDPSTEEVKNLRREETIRATKILGVPRKNLHFLDLEDGALKEHEEEAEESIMKLLKEYSPVEIYIPYINDSHPDHQATNLIVRRCVQKIRLKSMIYQYPGSNKYERIGPLIEVVLNLLRKNRVKVDISEFLDLKKKAVNQFNSEISVISARQKKPLNTEIKRYLMKKETFYLTYENHAQKN